MASTVTAPSVHARFTKSQFTRRRVRIALRTNRVVEGNIHVTEGQSLSVFLSTRRFFVNLTEARWAHDVSDPMEHLGVRFDHVLWAIPLTGELAVSTTQPATGRPRWAELTMDDGTMLHAALYISEDMRLTDYIDGASGFIPVRQALVPRTRERMGELVVNTGAVLAIREIEGES